MTANLVGTVDQRGVFTVGGRAFSREFTLEQVDGEWRISDPSDGLIILEPDFERLYDQRGRLLPRPDRHSASCPTRATSSRGEAQPTALVERLLEGPSAALAAGVRNPLAGVAAAQRGDGERAGTATVDLTGAARPTRAAAGRDLRAARLDPGAARGSATVESASTARRSQLDGVPAEQTVDDWAVLRPRRGAGGRGRATTSTAARCAP